MKNLGKKILIKKIKIFKKFYKILIFVKFFNKDYKIFLNMMIKFKFHLKYEKLKF